MATLIVSFRSEQEAQAAIAKLTEAGLGEVRARVLDSSEPLSHEKNGQTSPIIDPDLGSIEVRPQETPKIPESMHAGEQEAQSGTVPAGEGDAGGVQVMIETDAANEDAVRRLLGMSKDG